MKYVNKITDVIGNTPLLKLGKTVAHLKPTIFMKLEYLNPAGAVKDRMAYYIVKEGEKSGKLKKGDTLVDNSSGNAAIATSMVAAALGYKAVFAVADKTSREKIDLIKAYGADVIITPTHVPWDDPRSSYMRAYELGQKPGYFYISQYHNQLNVEAHYKHTGPEIWEDTNGKITHFVAGIGTGGTISGAGKFLKEKNPDIKVIGVDPEGSMFYDWVNNGTTEGLELYPCKVEGIGTDMIVKAFHPEYVDYVIRAWDKDSFRVARQLAREEGILGGGTTGAHLWAAMEIAKELDESAIIVTLACDSGQRYLSKMFSDEWMREQGFDIEEKGHATVSLEQGRQI
ncbi:MAG TPA: cysteine synthase family protein [candidate division Zixibacteria bacterium]|nr:cysteine synthase family protein [candidate division Zixibacteria bacterium]HEQ98052.1 cysteine synthase family protein [candidate division Zixibacteria bacterium]